MLQNQHLINFPLMILNIIQTLRSLKLSLYQPKFSQPIYKSYYKNVENLLKLYPSKKEFCEKKVMSY